MNARLHSAITAAEHLSNEEQELLAELIESEIAWDLSLDDPRHHAALDALEEQARREIAASDVFDDPGKPQ
jgi:hypothetical protein